MPYQVSCVTLGFQGLLSSHLPLLEINPGTKRERERERATALFIHIPSSRLQILASLPPSSSSGTLHMSFFVRSLPRLPRVNTINTAQSAFSANTRKVFDRRSFHQSFVNMGVHNLAKLVFQLFHNVPPPPLPPSALSVACGLQSPRCISSW
ncbi:hypothetical protein EYC84_000296 [Monilinia fructicola]|uniref:Uncharacterized protein n=1 Tax=Monilinia fructicola TaxID=38448 RepID=A0A5M9JR78_MONFR|nr:hypothetical protein EYC84_000296 [Monilinia fructicola]